MSKLPHNVERIKDGFGGYRYRAYTKGGWCARLNRMPGGWSATTVSTNEYVGQGRTLEEIGAKCATFETAMD